MNTAQQMVDNNITMFGYPTGYLQRVFNASEDPALKKLAETYHITILLILGMNIIMILNTTYMRKVHTQMSTAILNHMNLKWENGGDLQNIFLEYILTLVF